jgi:5'-nucleotidase
VKPILLLTNDDGVHAPGIRALAAALESLGEVHVVAPDREVSACAQSLTVTRPLRAETLEPYVHAVDGTPADCVNLALAKLLPGRPDVIVSGINRGPNLGDDVFRSGTVGGAREGVFFGVPSLAVSLATRSDTADFGPAAQFAARLVRLVIEKGLPERTLLNVNVPAGEIRGVALTVQGRHEHEGTILEGLDPRRRAYFWIEQGKDKPLREDKLSDLAALRKGYVSVTPLQTDTTHHGALQALHAWEAALSRPCRR